MISLQSETRTSLLYSSATSGAGLPPSVRDQASPARSMGRTGVPGIVGVWGVVSSIDWTGCVSLLHRGSSGTTAGEYGIYERRRDSNARIVIPGSLPTHSPLTGIAQRPEPLMDVPGGATCTRYFVISSRDLVVSPYGSLIVVPAQIELQGTQGSPCSLL